MAELKPTPKSEKAIEGKKKMEMQNPKPSDNKSAQSEVHQAAPASEEMKSAQKPEEKKKPEVKKVKKTFAVLHGMDLHISKKHSMHLCDMIRNRDVDTAIKMCEDVMIFKQVVRMNNREVGHRHGPGIMAGRYPITAAKEFVKMLKELKANAIHNEVEIEKCRIQGKADLASRPFKSGGRRAKRCHVTLWLMPKKEIKGKLNQNKSGVKK
jgi:ribosomal protein L22